MIKRGGTVNFKHVFTSERPGKVEDYFNIQKTQLGEGSYGHVYKGTDKSTGAARAIKSVGLKNASETEKIERELAIQQSLDHPHIVKMFEVFKDAKRYYLVMELCTGGELFDRIIEKVEKSPDGTAFNERDCVDYMSQILGAMQYLHTNEYVHRDIKPENFLLESPDAHAAIKIIDFGLAKHFKAGDPPMKTKAGTPYYVAPQVLAGSYDEKCDIWSCGVIMYILLCGFPPFFGDTDADILRMVKKGQFDFPSPEWDKISKGAKDLIKKMLTLDPAARPSAASLISDERWLIEKAPEAPVGAIDARFSDKLKGFSSMSKLKKLALTVVAQQFDQTKIKDLKDTFTALDKNKDGTLSMQEIHEGFTRMGLEFTTELEQSLRRADTDGSGNIDYTEFIAATLDTRHYLKDEVLWSAFRTFDLNGDGKIDRSELRIILNDDKLRKMDAEIEAMLKDGDIDGDGEIDFDEFKALMKK
jgi:calcium-dependent protein kinase